MSFKSWESYRKFSLEVKHGSRYVYSADVDDFLSNVLKTSKQREMTIESGTVLWRAQLGNEWKTLKLDGEEIEGAIPIPFPSARMKPPIDGALEGRANPKGIPYLYLANNKYTAKAEVRPWLDSKISVGQFQPVRDLRVIDCSKLHAKGQSLYFNEPDEDKRELEVWADIDRAFSSPVSLGDKSLDYIPTQIIAELFKNDGFDGLIYKSALSKKGYSLVLFDIDTANIINCSLCETKEIKFCFDDETCE